MRYLKDKYLIGCSGGPDSMALLDMARQKGLIINVAHVNYHKRDSADRDEMIVRNYCYKYGIPFFRIDAKENIKGNFQSYARQVRYSFFKEIIKKQGLNALLVAHHQDDLLETYIMQKEKGIVPSYYGLRRRNVIDGVDVIRPLLNKKKSELMAYCDDNGIEYGIDESNLTDHYERNRIRNHILKDMNDDERKSLLKEIKSLNQRKKAIESDIKHFIGNKTTFVTDKLLSYPYLEDLVRYLVKKNLSSSYIQEIIRQLNCSDGLLIRCEDKAILKEYGYIVIDDYPNDYEIIVDNIRFEKHKHFKLSKTGDSFSGVTLSKNDFPITIRNYRDGDSINMLYGRKRLSRFFIDHKINKLERLSYPVMLNSKGEIILVPALGCDKGHYSIKHNVFMVKL